MISTTREELESYINEIEGDLEVQSLLSPEKRLGKESIKALEDSLAKAREQLDSLPPKVFSGAIIPFKCQDGAVRDVRVTVHPVSSPDFSGTPTNGIVTYGVLGGREVRVTLEVL